MHLENLDRFAREVCRLDLQRLLLVGLSGGADSLCLLDSLHSLGFRLAAAHFDHRLRPESGAEAHLAEQMAACRGIPFVSGSGDVRTLAQAGGFSIEEAARKARYAFLFEHARRLGAAAVAVGHTADDQCETILMHFLRGSGLAGLRGMRPRAILTEWDATIPLVRPLLGAWRSETTAYCRERGFETVSDPTNAQMDFLRNRLRGEAIPFLEQYNARFRPALLRMAEVLSGDEEVLTAVFEDAWKSTLTAAGDGYTSLDAGHLSTLPVGLQRRACRRAVQRLVPDLRDIDFDSVERLLAANHSGGPRRPLELVDGILALREDPSLYIYRGAAALPDSHWPQLAASGEIELQIPGSVSLKNGWVINAANMEHSLPVDDSRENAQNEAWLDGDCLAGALVVRPPRPGDRFQPLGFQTGSIKVSDFFINEKVPRRARRNWPLVFSGNQLVWIPGLRSAALARVTSEATRIIHLRLEPTQP